MRIPANLVNKYTNVTITGDYADSFVYYDDEAGSVSITKGVKTALSTIPYTKNITAGLHSDYNILQASSDAFLTLSDPVRG